MDSTAQAEPVATASYPSSAATTTGAATEAAAEEGSFCVNPNATKKSATGTISGRFLHSEENLEECYESTDDDEGDTDFEEDNECCEEDEDNDDTEEFHRKATAFSRSREGVMRALSNHSLTPPPGPPPPSSSSSQQTTDKSNRSTAAEQRLHQRHTHNQQNQRQQHKQQHKQQQQHWARRQLYRSVSVDDLMEYQREFSLAAVGRTSSDHNINTHTTIITEYQREFRAILAGQQHEVPRNNNSHTKNTSPTIEQESSGALALASAASPPIRKVSRKSIANSDLADFKRQMCQMELADQQQGDSKEEGTTDSATDNKKKGPLVDSKVLSEKLETLQKDASDYQWGTRSLRRAILGSDLGTFERSVRTALLETSRENSSDSLVCPDDDDDNDNDNGQGKCDETAQESSNHVGQIHQPLAEQAKNEEDWGTRSLRKSLKELDYMDDSSRRQYQSHSSAGPAHRTSSSSRQMSNICEYGEIVELELDTPIQCPSPWQDDKQNPPSVNGLKMPRRVTSNENVPSVNGLKMPRRVTSNENVHGHGGDGEDQQANNHSNNNTDDKSTTAATSPSSSAHATQSRRSSMNDMSIVCSTPDQADGPEFEWKMRSRFRRSISSSDIEKYQRHLTALEEDSERLSDSEGDDLSIHTIAVVESVPAVAKAAIPESVNTPPLLSPAFASNITSSPWDPSDEKKKSATGNDDTKPKKPKRDRKPRRRHRRSTSDVPELHMDNIISDVAPRKPTRTNSRPISPPPPRQAAVVRFADNNNQVVEIPKVSEDMKPFLFYTKRDVKRFRMNEHRRQEEQIRSYVEYLNQKENALDASQCW